ncbi:MAG: CerR family C-terminal domain-containing protein [Phycisphaerales bacterium]
MSAVAPTPSQPSPENPAEQGAATRARLLEVAGEEFARRGFHDATVREICKRAGANIAAINYHFGDKAGLYREVFRTAVCRFREGGKLVVPAEGTPAERLSTFLRLFMERVTGNEHPAWAPTLMMREMIEPTEALDEVVQGMIRPTFFGVAGVVGELLGRPATDGVVLRSTASIMSQCVWYRHSSHIVKRLFDGTAVGSDTPRQRAEHIAAFSLLALESLRASGGGGAC